MNCVLFYTTGAEFWDEFLIGLLGVQYLSKDHLLKITAKLFVCLFVKTIYLQISAVEARSLAFANF